MKKEDVNSFNTAFDYCYEKATINVSKYLQEDLEEVRNFEASIFKDFCKTHPQLGLENWQIIKLESTLFTRRLEYMIACKYV